MQELMQLLLTLDRLYRDPSLDEYEKARQMVEAKIKETLPGFTVAYAVEIGTVGAGEETYQHGGVAHVLLPLRVSRE